MLHRIASLESTHAMPVGRSGRIVIEIDPEQKQELYAALNEDNLNLKQWFLKRVEEYVRDRRQLSLRLWAADGDEDKRKYG